MNSCHDRCTKTDELFFHFIHGKITAMTITEGLGYSEVHAQWVPKMLIDAYKEQKAITTDL
jgi:hypothetical protein